MPVYAEREDVLRKLGGTLDTIQARFDRRLWDGSYPLTTISVDDNDIEIPDTILTRIDQELIDANSRVSSAVLAAYQAEPTTVPAHLRASTARIAAYHVLATDGVQTEHIKMLHKETESFLRDLAGGKMDLGITSPRPKHRRPAAMVSRGVGGGSSRRGRGRGRGGCGC